MNLLILGGTGRTGRLVVEKALDEGHAVTVLVRSPEKLASPGSALHVVAGKATDAGDVERAMIGADTVISALGGEGSVITDSTRAVITAAHKTGVKRFVVMSSWLVERDRMDALSRLATGLIRGSKIKDKIDGEVLLRRSDLDWTLAYPGPLTDSPPTGFIVELPEGARRHITERISRADVAAWLVEAATGRETSRRAVDITGRAAARASRDAIQVD